MQLRIAIAVLTLIVAISGCAIPSNERVFIIEAPFDEAVATRQLEDGENSIKGNAFVRQQGGGVVTCAGATVWLIPATRYARERIVNLYGNVSSGASKHRGVRFNPDPRAFYERMRTTKCDSQGNFQFERVADGEFIVVTEVVWRVGDSAQGGPVMHRLTVGGGKPASIVISP